MGSVRGDVGGTQCSNVTFKEETESRRQLALGQSADITETLMRRAPFHRPATIRLVSESNRTLVFPVTGCVCATTLHACEACVLKKRLVSFCLAAN